MPTDRHELRKLLHARGYRSTPQRQTVLDALEQGGGHMTAEEVYASVRAASPNLNRATVYRALNFLCGLNVVSAAEMNGRRVYEIVGDPPHHHLVCRSCGRQYVLDAVQVDRFFAAVERAQGFTPANNHLVLHGLCQKCRARRRRE